MSTSSATSPMLATDGSASAAPLSAAVGLSSSRTTLPVQLDLTAANFTKWNIFFKALLGRHGLLHHVDGSAAPASTDASWASDDYAVLSVMVFVGTVSEFCVKHADCPVITIKRKANEAPQDPVDD